MIFTWWIKNFDDIDYLWLVVLCAKVSPLLHFVSKEIKVEQQTDEILIKRHVQLLWSCRLMKITIRWKYLYTEQAIFSLVSSLMYSLTSTAQRLYIKQQPVVPTVFRTTVTLCLSPVLTSLAVKFNYCRVLNTVI